MEWQHIKTAPMDGTEIIAYDGDGYYFARYIHPYLLKPQWVDNTDLPIIPTHWMPIPNPPIN